MTTIFKKHEYLFSFTIIFLVVLVSNLHAVFGLDILLLDDNARYYLFVNDQYKIADPRSFIGSALLLKWVAVAIFSTYSAELARLYILLIYMIPVSCLFYIINRKYLHLSIWVSLTSAVLINIIPKQVLIPTFLDGSYPAPGMLVFLASLIIATIYLRKSRTDVFLLIIASIAWILVCDTIAEMGIFLFPALLYYIHSSDAEFRRKAYLYLTTSTITVYRTYFYLQSVGANPTNKAVNLTVEQITKRIINSIEWWLPVKLSTTMTIIAGCLIIIMLVYAYISNQKSSYKKCETRRAYIFYSIWFLSCSFPFWFLSKYFSPRYFYISYLALTTLALIAAYQIFILSKRNKQLIASISLVALVLLYGTQRYLINIDQFTNWNNKNKGISELLSEENINENTQIALVNIKNGTGGYHMWSTGYLQYLLQKPSIRGVMGNEMNFYDPFNLKHCGYSYTMSCLDKDKELVAYKKDIDNKSVRMQYFLQWVSEGKLDSEWLLYQTDKENKLSVLSAGTGIDTYKARLSELKLSPEEILWGNSKDKKALSALR